MKKILVLVLLISLGVNIGLGVRFWKRTCGVDHAGQELRHSHGTGFPGRSGPGGRGTPRGGHDDAFWQEVMERRLAHVTERLGLDNEQSEAFKKTHREASAGFLAQRVKVQAARHRLMDAASAADFGVDTLRHLIADVGRQQAKLDSMVTETMLQEMEILNGEQRRQYMRILPVNRFGGGSGGSGYGKERGGGHRRH